MLMANSLVSGFLGSNAMGRGIVLVQLLCSVLMLTFIIGKWLELRFLERSVARFRREFSSMSEILGYYMRFRPNDLVGIVGLYRITCERLLTQLSPEARGLVAGRSEGAGAAALSQREIDLVDRACEHALDEEELRVQHGMGLISTVISLAPMLGLLGTVWGVLDAFAEMGSAGSANLATIAPSISAALVTTVVGLLIAMPGMAFYSMLGAKIRTIRSSLEGFADELMGRIACEYQGRGV